MPFRRCDCRRNDALRGRELATREGADAAAGAAGDGVMRALAAVAGAGASAMAGMSVVRLEEAVAAAGDLSIKDLAATAQGALSKVAARARAGEGGSAAAPVRRGKTHEDAARPSDAARRSSGAERRASALEADRAQRRPSGLADEPDMPPKHTECRRPAFVVVKALTTRDEVARRVRCCAADVPSPCCVHSRPP